ncbi:4Fe-4S dicluster domain-containing protein [Clostridium sporogenes]|uniref:nitroreductase family protein n=1 Tax=Clostridium sporogenes TaxID=1509 RepID=UPI0013D7C372|nr:nitroreductase family protein [Clostridium sporogenes]NFV11683.1 4Fe-4S dicluster domain-containing protein [Clostridium sporogenes]
MKEHIIQVDKSLCIGCGLCISDCPVNNIIIKEKKAVIKNQECIKCGHCEAICPKAAVTLTGFSEKTMEIAEKTTLNPRDLLIALKTRRTIRQFKNREVSLEIIQQIIKAGRVTPSAKNTQNVSYIVLGKDKGKYEEVAVKFFRKIQGFAKLWMKGAKEVTIDDNFFFKKAPIAIMVVTKDKVSGSLAASNMALMAESYGLGVLYSGFFTVVANYSKKLRRILNLKHGDHVVTTLVIGYPNVKYRRTAKKEEAVVRYL